jgi:hypothetical protein
MTLPASSAILFAVLAGLAVVFHGCVAAGAP